MSQSIIKTTALSTIARTYSKLIDFKLTIQPNTPLFAYLQLLSADLHAAEIEFQSIAAEKEQDKKNVTAKIKTAINRPKQWFQNLNNKFYQIAYEKAFQTAKLSHFDELCKKMAEQSLLIQALYILKADPQQNCQQFLEYLSSNNKNLLQFFHIRLKKCQFFKYYLQNKKEMGECQLIDKFPQMSAYEQILNQIKENDKNKQFIHQIMDKVSQLQFQLIDMNTKKNQNFSIKQIKQRLQKLLMKIKVCPKHDKAAISQFSAFDYIKQQNQLIDILQLIYNGNSGLLTQKIQSLQHPQIKMLCNKIKNQLCIKNKFIDEVYQFLFNQHSNNQLQSKFLRSIRNFHFQRKMVQCCRLMKELKSNRGTVSCKIIFQKQQNEENCHDITRSRDSQIEETLRESRLQSDKHMLQQEQEIYQLKTINQQLFQQIQQKQEMLGVHVRQWDAVGQENTKMKELLGSMCDLNDNLRTEFTLKHEQNIKIKQELTAVNKLNLNFRQNVLKLNEQINKSAQRLLYSQELYKNAMFNLQQLIKDKGQLYLIIQKEKDVQKQLLNQIKQKQNANLNLQQQLKNIQLSSSTKYQTNHFQQQTLNQQQNKQQQKQSQLQKQLQLQKENEKLLKLQLNISQNSLQIIKQKNSELLIELTNKNKQNTFLNQQISVSSKEIQFFQKQCQSLKQRESSLILSIQNLQKTLKCLSVDYDRLSVIIAQKQKDVMFFKIQLQNKERDVSQRQLIIKTKEHQILNISSRILQLSSRLDKTISQKDCILSQICLKPQKLRIVSQVLSYIVNPYLYDNNDNIFGDQDHFIKESPSQSKLMRKSSIQQSITERNFNIKHSKSLLCSVNDQSSDLLEWIAEQSENMNQQNETEQLKKSLVAKDKSIKKYQFYLQKYRSQTKKSRAQVLDLQVKVRKLQLQIIRLNQTIEETNIQNQLFSIQQNYGGQQMRWNEKDQPSCVQKLVQKQVELKVKEEELNFKIEQIIKHVLKLNLLKVQNLEMHENDLLKVDTQLIEELRVNPEFGPYTEI